MKKLLACSVAVLMAASMMTACGDTDDKDSSSKKETTAATEAKEAESAAEESKAEESEGEATESAATESAAEGDESASDSEGGESAPGATFTPLADIAGQLKNYENASLKFAADTDLSFVEMFNEDVAGLPGQLEYDDAGLLKYQGDEAMVDFSVQEVGGVPMLKVNELVYQVKPDGTPKYLIPKVRFDMNKLFKGHEEDMEKIFTIKTDLVAVGRNQQLYDTGLMSPVCVPWYGGAFGVNNNDTWNGNMAEFSMSSLASGEGEETPWSNQWAVTEAMCRPGIMGGDATFSKDFEKNYVTFMAWSVASHMDFYIADVVFEDADGNVIAVPEENLPGGASYTPDELPNLDEANAALAYDEAGNCVYEDASLVVDPEYVEGFDPDKATQAAIAALE